MGKIGSPASYHEVHCLDLIAHAAGPRGGAVFPSVPSSVWIQWLALNANTVTDFLAARIQRNENKRSVIELERRFSELSDEKRALESLGFPTEKAIRERFKMIRPGERIIVLEDPAQPSSEARIDSPQP